MGRVGTAQIIRANSRDLPLADNSVDLVVTSPPYFALRSYQDGGEHYAGQIGDEPTPAEFIDSLLEVTRECVRVLKPSGSLWVNLGDKYSTGSGGQSNLTELGKRLGTGGGQKQDSAKIRSSQLAGMKPKSLIGIPWRYAIRCIDDLGLILRAEVIWSKPNGLPESVTDRVRRSHEQWFHFTLAPRYYSAVDEIREEHSSFAGFRGHAKQYGKAQRQDDGRNNVENADPSLGKLPGSVWTVPTEPLQVPDHLGIDHFAAFPTEWPRRIIQGWSPASVCVECGEGRRPVSVALTAASSADKQRERGAAKARRGASHNLNYAGAHEQTSRPRALAGYACACPERTWETPRHQRRHVRRLLPAGRVAHQRPQATRQSRTPRVPPQHQTHRRPAGPARATRGGDRMTADERRHGTGKSGWCMTTVRPGEKDCDHCQFAGCTHDCHRRGA